MIKKLRIKFVLINMVIVTVMLGIIFGFAYQFTKKDLETESISMMQSVAADPKHQRMPGEFPEQVSLPFFSVTIGPYGDIATESRGFFDLSDEEFIDNVLSAAISSGEETGVLEQYNLRFCKSLNRGEQCYIFADMSSEISTLNGLTKTFVLIGVLSLAVFTVISILLARWAVKPVDEAWTQQKQFVADASHELKTPLTVIMTNAELLQNEDYDEQAKSRFADSILTMSQQMRGLVESLLDLARADNGQVKMSFEALELSRLVEDAALPFEPVFFEKGLCLECRTEENISVRGSAQHIKQLVDILLDNAQKYSVGEGTARLTLVRQGKNHCLLTVSNPGDELSSADLKNIFKRFYRLDKARSIGGGYGLGLSIAQTIAAEHKGKIWAESSKGENRFCVLLPTL